MKPRVLVFPCGSEIGLEVFKSLNRSTHFNLFGGSSVKDHGIFAYQNYIGDIPYVDAPNFIDSLNTVIKEHNIDFIIPTHDSVVLKLAEEKSAGNLTCELISSPLETCEIARSKSRTYEELKHLITTPKLYKNSSEVKTEDLPVFLKPDVGQGSKGASLALTLDQVKAITENNPDMLIMENLPGKEYTVDCFTNKEGELIFCEGRERARIMNGISVNTYLVEDQRFREIGSKINQSIQFQGAWFFQLKENTGGDLSLLEIAPRIAGTMALARCRGINLVQLSLFDRMGIEVEISENQYDLELDRALSNSYQHNIEYSHVYLDLDDVVIIDGKVNTEVMAFVFQCMNKGVKVHLLTRHRQDLDTSLNTYRLHGLFDELLWVKDGEEKADYINESKAIFIDDSFSERDKIYKAKAIPVFDVHMVEALIEKF